MENFGIPDEVATAQQLQGQIAANSDNLYKVAYDLAKHLGVAVSNNDGNLGAVQRKIKQQLQGRVNGNNKLLGNVTAALEGQLTGAIGALGSQIATVPEGGGIRIQERFKHVPQKRGIHTPPTLPTLPTQPLSPQSPPSPPPVVTPPVQPPPQPILPQPQPPIRIDPTQGPIYYMYCLDRLTCEVVDINDSFGRVPDTQVSWQVASLDDAANRFIAYLQSEGVSPLPTFQEAYPQPDTTGFPSGYWFMAWHEEEAPPIEPVQPVEPTPVDFGPPPTEQPPTDIYPEGPPEPSSPPATWTFPQPTQCPSFNPPGSPEFCQDIEAIAQMIASFGNAIADFVDASLDPDKVLGDDIPLEGYYSAPLTGGQNLSTAVLNIGVFLNNVRSAMKKAGKDSLSLLQTAFRWVRSMVQCTLPCDPIIPTGIWFFKMLVRVLKNVRLGSDLGLWATLDAEWEALQVERILDYLANYYCPIEVPGIPEAIECYLKGTIDEQLAFCWIQLHGGNPTVWRNVLLARRERLTPEEAIQYGRRQGVDDGSIRTELQTLGFIDPHTLDAKLELYNELPSVQDHLHWLQRNVFDTEYVEKYQLMQGFEDRFWVQFGDDLTALGMRKKYAAYHYAAHWVMPSPGQMLEFVYRLRPDKPGVDAPFTLDDYTRVLAEQDYNPYMRERFAATAYQVPALSYVRDMYRLGVIGDDELVGYHQDLGYTKEDSERFLGVDKVHKARIMATQARGWTPSAIANAYANRLLDGDSATLLMRELGFTDLQAEAMKGVADASLQGRVITRARSRLITGTVKEVRSAIAAGVMDVSQAALALVGLGFTPQQAAGIANAEHTTARVQAIQTATRAVKRAWIAGEIDEPFAIQQLQSIGLQGSKINEFIGLWHVEQSPARKRRTAKEIVGDVASGSLAPAEALYRLRNLGYPDADARLYISDARSKIVANEAKRLAADQKKGVQRQKELERLARLQQRQVKDIQKALRTEVPPGKLQKWAKLGLVTAEQFTERMALYGYPKETIDKWWDEACSSKNAACSPGETATLGPAASGSSPPTTGGSP